MLEKANFKLVPGQGKGSHTKWKHPLYSRSIILSGKDSSDAKRFQELDIKKEIKEVKENES